MADCRSDTARMTDMMFFGACPECGNARQAIWKKSRAKGHSEAHLVCPDDTCPSHRSLVKAQRRDTVTHGIHTPTRRSH
jgi:hypothetical protein